jgi:RecA-family ATPase
VVLLSHPSLVGISSQSGISGSTQWHNAVRARIYLRSVKDEGDEQPASDLRSIEFKKNQYGPISEAITLRYRDGMFLPEGSKSVFEKAAAEATVDDVFAKALPRYVASGLSPNRRAPNYLPRILAETAEAKAAKISEKALAAAMDRALAKGDIEIVEEGPPSKRRSRIAANPSRSFQHASNTLPKSTVPSSRSL